MYTNISTPAFAIGHPDASTRPLSSYSRPITYQHAPHLSSQETYLRRLMTHGMLAEEDTCRCKYVFALRLHIVAALAYTS